MIRDPLDPQPIQTTCKLCEGVMMASFHWVPVINKWWRPSVHDKCAAAWEKNYLLTKTKPVERPIPERFADFEPARADAEAIQAASEFLPSSSLHALAIIGMRARGKSRIMWAVIQGFFDQLERETGARRWVDYFLFSELVCDPERGLLNDVKNARYAFIDDVGSTECYGRDKSQLQAIIRARLQKQMWTFLTIDSTTEFDPGFKDLFRGRAVTVYIDD
jgi:hypothetical protein